MGTKINIIQRNNVLIPNEDEEISQKFTEVFSKKYNVFLGYEMESVTKNSMSDGNDDGDDEVPFHLSAKNKSGKKIELDTDKVLVSAGRVPNTSSLELEKTGVKTSEKGFIEVDDYLETTSKGIFALGDVVGRYQLKHNANLEAKYAYGNITNYGEKRQVDYTAMPHAVFSSPQVAGVGFTEQELRKKASGI